MFKMTLKYMGFDGKEREKDFYFNLTKGEIAEIHMSLPGGIDGFLDTLSGNPEPADVVTVFRTIILKSYGKRTPDGKFYKSKELSDEFAATDAYSELFLKFLDNDDDFITKFMEGTISAPIGTIQKILEDNPKIEEAKAALATEF